jgi:hypothetical protein
MTVTRDPYGSSPQQYRGYTLRSIAELRVAQALDEHGVEWEYEQPVMHPTKGRPVHYLPDFHILKAPAELGLCEWVEVKPDSLLHQLRDMHGVDELLRDSDPARVRTTAEEMKAAGVEELWKPKALAEITEQRVLVVGTVNANRRLSVTMYPSTIVFTKRNPFVNWRGHVQRLEQEAQRAAWQAEYRRREAERAAASARADAERAQRLVRIGRWVEYRDPRTARYAGRCICCGVQFAAEDLHLYPNDEGQWVVLHAQHDAQARRAAWEAANR